MAKNARHKVFTSYHVGDEEYKGKFVKRASGVIIDKSVNTGNIDDADIKVATVRQKIREDYIADSTVTVVLIGPRTWQRKHVDWEISYSIRETKKSLRCGLLGIVLPSHPDYGKGKLRLRLVPERLADNCGGADPYAIIYDWPKRRAEGRLRDWIHRAFVRRNGANPNNSRTLFKRNRRGRYMKGWSGKGSRRTLGKVDGGIWE